MFTPLSKATSSSEPLVFHDTGSNINKWDCFILSRRITLTDISGLLYSTASGAVGLPT